MIIGLLFALSGAVGYGLAAVLQAVAARGAGSTLRTLGRPLYLLGLGLDLVGWVCSLVALRTLPVVEVQTILAGSLAVTALGGRIALGTRLRRLDVAAIVVTVGALAVVAASTGLSPTPRSGLAINVVLAVAAVAVAACGALAARWSAAASAVIAGVAFGGAALCAQVITFPAHHVFLGLVTQLSIWALLGFGGIGMLLYAHALERGGVGPVTALMWIAEVIAPTLAGALLLGDPIPITPQFLIALVVALAAAVVLANAPQPEVASSADPASLASPLTGQAS